MNVFFSGQSFAQALMVGAPKTALMQTLEAGGFQGQINGYAIGGAAADKAHAPSTHPDRYYWDSVTMTEGPALVKAKAHIAPLVASGLRFGCIVHNLGEGDSMAPMPTVAPYKTANAWTIWRLKLALWPENPNGVRTMLMHVGRRLAHETQDIPGVQMIREAQIEMDGASPTLFAAPGIYDVTLLGDVDDGYDSHPTGYSYDIYARRLAHSIRWLYGDTTANAAPRLYGAAARPDFTIELTIASANRRLLMPSNPWGFAVRQNGQIYDDLGFWWENGKLILNAPLPTADPVEVIYPYGMLRDMDQARVIRDDTGCPVTPFKVLVTMEVSNV